MEVHRSARKHDVADADLRHAIDHCLYRAEVVPDESPLRVLYLGPDRAGNLLEIVVIQRDDGSELAIHAMKMRQQYKCLIFPRR